MKLDWNSVVKERYKLLEQINRFYREYHRLKGVKKISLTPFESHYAEYLVAKKLVDEGLTIQSMYEKGCDIECNNKKIEVKSGRLQRHVKGVKHDFWGWVVKTKQWQSSDHFDYLVCVALDYWRLSKYSSESKDQDGILVFPYEDVKNNFTKCGWKYLNYDKWVENYLRLNLVNDGYDAFLENVRYMRKPPCEFKGELSEFEKEFNKNPMRVFQQYSWEKFIKNFGHANED